MGKRKFCRFVVLVTELLIDFAVCYSSRFSFTKITPTNALIEVYTNFVVLLKEKQKKKEQQSLCILV
jgi:hypothetical protein